MLDAELQAIRERIAAAARDNAVTDEAAIYHVAWIDAPALVAEIDRLRTCLGHIETLSDEGHDVWFAVGMARQALKAGAV